MNGIRAIPVIYNEVKFKSMTEAKMAIFFDLLGFKWEYEPEKFELRNKLSYIPDFIIHNVNGRVNNQDIYVECKGNELTDKDWQKLVVFGDFKKKIPSRPFLIVNDFFWFERFYKAPSYIDNIKARRPRNAYGLWFYALFTVSKETTSDIAILCKDKNAHAAVMSESEFYTNADIEATINAFNLTREANFGSTHKFTGFNKNNLPADIDFDPDDIPNF